MDRKINFRRWSDVILLGLVSYALVTVSLEVRCLVLVIAGVRATCCEDAVLKSAPRLNLLALDGFGEFGVCGIGVPRPKPGASRVAIEEVQFFCAFPVLCGARV